MMMYTKAKNMYRTIYFMVTEQQLTKCQLLATKNTTSLTRMQHYIHTLHGRSIVSMQRSH